MTTLAALGAWTAYAYVLALVAWAPWRSA